MSFDTGRYLALYVSEATEHLEHLTQNLVKLESGGLDPAVVDEAFRHAHSVKGMSASMGYEPTTQLAHRLEDVLDALRNQKRQLDKQSIDVMLSTCDVLLEHVRAAQNAREIPDAREPLQALAAHFSELSSEPFPAKPTVTARPVAPASGEAPKTAPAPDLTGVPRPVFTPPPATEPVKSPAPAPPGSTPVGLPPRYSISLKVAPGSKTPGVRAFLAYKRLTSLGNVFDLRPPLDDLKAGRLQQGMFSLEFESVESETNLRAALNTIVDVELASLRLVEWHPQSAPLTPQRAPLPETRPIGEEVSRTVRVKAELLDQLLEGVSELLLSTARVRELGRLAPENLRTPLESEVDQLHGRVKDLHAKVMKARMTPIAVLTDRLPRVVRDITRRRERDVELSITGSETELDRAIVDELTDPLTHILRNAIDHGIEPAAERERARKPPKGRVQVSVRREKERVVLEIDDDGRGIDGEKLKAKAVARGFITPEQATSLSPSETLMLCCLPGVSTAADVTDISGRGVGMDAVKRTIESVGGTLEIESQLGHGTRFRLLLPLTVAVVQLLLVEVGDEMLGIPVAKVTGVVEVPEASLSQSQEASLLSFAKTWVPVYSLGQLLTLPTRKDAQALRPYVVVEGDRGKVALEVDRLKGQEEAVLKALYRPLDLVSGLSGVTILGNGRPIFILDVQRLIP